MRVHTLWLSGSDVYVAWIPTMPTAVSCEDVFPA